jgi:hypothetical protein
LPAVLAYPYNSKIPAALDAITAAFTAAFTNSSPRVFVRDGPWNAGESGGSYAQDMAIGWYGFYPGYQYPTRALSEELGEAAVTAQNIEAGWAPGQEETFTVGCASLVMSGSDPSPGEWSRLRHMAYGNIATASTYIADPQQGGQYLDSTVEKLVIARTNACHLVAQRRGVLCIVSFSLDCTTTSQQ